MKDDQTPQSALAPANDTTPDVPRWDNARRWVEAATKFARASLACQVMAGFELLELHKRHEIKRGKKKMMMYHDDTSLFQDLVERELPVKRNTAYRWMKIAKFIQEKSVNMDASERLRMLLQSPPDQWTADESQLVSDFVRELTEGKTQVTLLVELGLAKRLGAAHQPADMPVVSSASDTPAPAEPDRDAWIAVGRTLSAYGARFVREPDDKIREQVEALDAAIRVRRNWLNLPMELRDPKVLEVASEQAQAA